MSRLKKDSLFLSENPHMPYCGGYSYIQTRKQYHGEVNYLSEVIHAGPVAVWGEKVLPPLHINISKIQLKFFRPNKLFQNFEEDLI